MPVRCRSGNSVFLNVINQRLIEFLHMTLYSVNFSNINYEELDKSFLILRIKQLEKHVTQLQNIIKKLSLKKLDNHTPNKLFEFSKHSKRHVCLKILYLGWEYKGFVVQDNVNNTIENHLFIALQKTKLIESRQTSNYHRCGRTDKGVSAYSQVISIDLRSNLKYGPGIMTWDGLPSCHPGVDNTALEKDYYEFNYCKLLNKVLPYDIRVYAWAPVAKGFSARFDCHQRVYRYILPTRSSHHPTEAAPPLDIDLIEGAANKLCGFHDFRNFCCMDVANGVTNYDRTLTSIQRIPLEASGSHSVEGPMSEFLMLELKAPSFLWHQVRCLIAILAMIGAGREEVAVIDELFNTNTTSLAGEEGDSGEVRSCRAKPNYKMAPDYPLVLWDCTYDGLEWNYDGAQLKAIITNLKELWIRYSIKALVIQSIINDLSNLAATKEVFDASQQPGVKNLIYDCFRADSFAEFLPQPMFHPNTHRKLRTRQCGLSLEEKLEVKRIKAKEYDMKIMVEKKVMDEDELKCSNIFEKYSHNLLTYETGQCKVHEIDFIICLGGDGTLLYASSLFQESVPPIMAFHLGSLGFLAPFDFANYRHHISHALKGNCLLVLRSRLRCVITSHDTSQKESQTIKYILNEITIDRGLSPYLCILDLYIENRLITTVQGDGLIIATPTGSTAYACAAGSSMVHPAIPAIVITPICAHSLSFRPIVVPAGVEIKITLSPQSRDTVWTSYDGQYKKELKRGDYLTITTSIYPIPSICFQNQVSDWFAALKKSLHWNDRQIQKAL